MVDFVEKAYAQALERAQALPPPPPARPQTAAPRAPSAQASSAASSLHRPPSGARRPASAGAPACWEGVACARMFWSVAHEVCSDWTEVFWMARSVSTCETTACTVCRSAG